MICPAKIARDLSALRAARVGDHAKHGFLFEGRGGAGDESTGSDVAGDGEEDHGWWPAYPVAHICLLLADVGLLPSACHTPT